MPKRSLEDKMDHYIRKMEKLRDKQRRKRRRREDSPTLSEFDQDDQYLSQGDESARWEPAGPDLDQSYEEQNDTAPLQSFEPAPPASAATPAPARAPLVPDPVQTEPSLPALDSEVLSALGDATDPAPLLGDDIHYNLCQLWDPLLKKGMNKEAKDKVLKQYLVPSNCTLLQAPKLNVEISAAVIEMVKLRDKKVEASQQQLGIGITAISRALTSLMTSADKIEAIRMLSDSCRILCDLHHSNTQTRIKMITPGLAKSSLNVTQDCERDDTLFGASLQDKIKASKTIEKQGLQIKKPAPPSRPSAAAVQPAASAPARPFQGNWTGPPRYPTNRGGGEVGAGTCHRRDDQHRRRQLRRRSTEPLKAGHVFKHVTSADINTHSTGRLPWQQRLSPVRVPTPRHATSRAAALDLMLASLSNSTLQQYGVCYKLWWQYCHETNHNYFEQSVPHVITFLSQQFEKGASYGTLNSHRSALSLLLGNSLASNDNVKRLLKGAFRLRPSLPKYSSTWDPQLVLRYISEWVPNNELSLEQLTKKLVVLLALCTAHRVQTFSLIKINNIIIKTSGVDIIITDIIKTSGIGRAQPVLFLPYFLENLSICPATTLTDYMSATKDLRPSDNDYLLITVKRPHKRATAQSISRWIKQTLCASGVDVAVYGAHSARHAATSAARAAGVSIDLIRKTAGWSASSQAFAKFYNRPVFDNSNFATSVCLQSNSE